MKAPLLTSIAREIASTLMPSRINVEKDSLAKAIARKSNNHTISRQTESKLLSISNYHALPATAYEETDSFTLTTPVQEIKQQLDDVSRQSGRSRKKSRASGEKIDKIVNSIKLRVGFAEDILTKSYWKSRDGATADMQAQASTAVDRLGYQPEHKDYCLTQQVSRLTQEMHIPEQALIRMHTAFHGIYRIPQRDEANTPPLTFSDFPDPGILSEFVSLTAAAEDLRDAYNLLPSFHSDAVRGSVERTLKNLDQIVHSARSALTRRYDELVAQPQDATEELNAICTWLGNLDAPNESPVYDDDTSQVSMTNAECIQVMDDHPGAVSEAGSNDSYSTMDSFGTERPGRMSSINLHDDDESIGDVDDLFDSSASTSWDSDSDSDSESARHDRSSLAGFDLPFAKLPTSGGVYFGDPGRIINTRKMTLEEAFATKLLNESVSTTTIDKLDIIFERLYGITLTTSGVPRFELASFANPFKKGLRRPYEGLDDLAAISRRLDQMRPSQARDDLKQALALYQTHLKEAGNWWRAEAQRLAENPPPAARTDLQEMHALQLDVAMAWLADSDA